MIETFLGLTVATLIGYATGWWRGKDHAIDEHNAKVQRMGEHTLAIIEENERRYRVRLDALKQRVASIAAQCGVELPAERGDS